MASPSLPWVFRTADTSYISELTVTTAPIPPGWSLYGRHDTMGYYYFQPMYTAIPKGVLSVTHTSPRWATPATARTPIDPGSDTQQVVKGPAGTALAQMVAYQITMVYAQTKHSLKTWASGVAWQFVFRPIIGMGPDTIVRIPVNAPGPPASVAPPVSGLYATTLAVTTADPQPSNVTGTLTIGMLLIASLWQNIAKACAQQGGPLCDRAMSLYCGAINPADPVCACINSAASQPTCSDARCADQPGAYRLAAQTRTPCTGAPVSCQDWAALGDGKYLSTGALPPNSGCGAPPAQIPVSNNHMLIFVLFLVMLLSALLYTQTAGSAGAASNGWRSSVTDSVT